LKGSASFAASEPDRARRIFEQTIYVVVKIGKDNQFVINEMRKASFHADPQTAVARGG
jgi:hypothetical protein